MLTDRLLTAATRSGLIETSSELAAAAVTADGSIVATWGDADGVFFYRSAIKPFQATVSQEFGADLGPEQMAIACASHGAQPVHVAFGRDLLAGAGIPESALRCPPMWPSSRSAHDRLLARGVRNPAPIFHNCSGKHAAMLRACAAQGWPLESYTDPEHPLQQAISDVMCEVTGFDPAPSGVDGCGVPAFPGTVVSLARSFARLTTEPRFAAAAEAMRRFPALLGSNERPDSRLGRWLGGPVKVGAAGVLAAGRHGLGIAVKSRAGSFDAAVVGMIEVMRRLGLIPPAAEAGLADLARRPVFGGGVPVGEILVVDAP